MQKSSAVWIQVITGVLIWLLPAALMAEKRAQTAIGIDVDFYTGPISHKVWQRLKEANQKFVIAQAAGAAVAAGCLLHPPGQSGAQD